MAANRFATMVHNNTNKITLVLIYAVLEWTLIIFLFLNSIFFYFIIKFTRFFGLKPPCIWCIHLDRILEPQNKNSHRYLLCESHSNEVSQLEFCSKHQKLAESHDMCEDCSSIFDEKSKKFTGFKCSCCGVDFDKKHCDDSSYFVINPSRNGSSISDLIGSDSVNDNFGVKHVHQKQGQETRETVIESLTKEDSNSDKQKQDLEFLLDYSGNRLVPVESIDQTTGNSPNSSDVDEDQEFGDFQKAEGSSESKTDDSFKKQETEDSAKESIFVSGKTEDSSKFAELDSMEFEETENSLVFHVNFNPFISESTQTPSDTIKLQETEEGESDHEEAEVSVELIHSATENFRNSSEVDEDQEFGDFQEAKIVSELKTEDSSKNQETDSVVEDASNELLSVSEKAEDSSKFAELDSMEFEETENSLVFHVNYNPFISEPTQTPLDTKEPQETEEGDSDHEEAEVSIGTEIPVLDSSDEMKAQDNFKLYSSSHEEPSTSSHDIDFNLEYGFEETLEGEKTEELNMNELENTLLMIERKDSMVDESCDGSEMDGGDPVNTTEKLKSALRAERKALQALYAELEEERSASAVAASETMAMINRLQEEKATMQMEALHYQRMMEEQSEYDQEALQLLNELMVKKDKELELYRKKVLDYEVKERMMFSTSSVKSVTCSGSCSHSEDEDGVWVDVNHESKEEGHNDGNHESRNQNPPVDHIVNQDSSFVDFEEERLSILEQLKVLEEKLFTLSDEEDRHFDELRQIDDFFEENGKHLNGDYGYDGQDINGMVNGFLNESHEIHYQDRRAIASTRKRPFTPFGALETENDEGVITSNGNGNGNGFHTEKVENIAVTRFELQKRRIDIEEEVEQLYVRLQALEADREFLKHCFGSLKKGDKGMNLLQEILQHLRDLRNIDLRAQSFTDGTLV